MLFVNTRTLCVNSDHSVLFCFLLAFFDCHNNLNYKVYIILFWGKISVCTGKNFGIIICCAFDELFYTFKYWIVLHFQMCIQI